MILVVDTESDDLADHATKLWVAVAKDYETGEMFDYINPGQEFIDKLEEADIIVMHNAIDHDYRVIHNILGYEIPKQKIFDTLTLSRFNKPDRKVPPGWTGKKAPHGVEAWGMRFGRAKPGHEDWSKFSPEMHHRCREDVEIQTMMFDFLLKEFLEMYDV